MLIRVYISMKLSSGVESFVGLCVCMNTLKTVKKHIVTGGEPTLSIKSINLCLMWVSCHFVSGKKPS